MKNKLRSVKNASTSASTSHPKTTSRLASKPVDTKAGDSSSKASEPKMSPEELDAWKEMRQRKLENPLTLSLEVVGCGDEDDSRLAEFLAGVIRDFAPDFWTHVISKLDDREAANFGEVIELANEVSSYYAALDRGEKDSGNSTPFPRRFFLPGYAKYKVMQTPEDVLFYLADPLYRHREAICKRILEPERIGVDKLQLVEALVIAQAELDRAGGDDETEACEQSGDHTRLVRLSWKIKAEYYADKLRRETTAESEAAIAADHATSQRRAA
jgi:hypothetical protein